MPGVSDARGRAAFHAARPPNPSRMNQKSPAHADVDAVLLQATSARVLDAWDHRAMEWGVSKEQLAAALSEITGALEDIRGGDLNSLEAPASRPTLLHRVSEALRIALLEHWAEDRASTPERGPRSPEEYLGWLHALNIYQGHVGPGGGQGLAARLADPDAFELVVELSHDLLSPLNSILFLSEVLRSGHSGAVNAQQRSQLGLIYSATLGLVSVVSDVMELASERRGIASEPGPFTIRRVFESVEEMVRPMAEEKEIALEFRLPNDDRCLGHSILLGRVLLNLTTNALKFTEEGKVVVSAERIGRTRIQFSVQDTGRGIPPEEKERVLHPFRKSSDRSGHFFSGSGLGLSIVQRLLASIGSELTFETEAGVGTRFSFDVELPPLSD